MSKVFTSRRRRSIPVDLGKIVRRTAQIKTSSHIPLTGGFLNASYDVTLTSLTEHTLLHSVNIPILMLRATRINGYICALICQRGLYRS